MYISFQFESTAYDAKLSPLWAKFLSSEWNKVPNHMLRDEWLAEEYGIVLDRNEQDVLIGILVPKELRTFVELRSTQFS